MGKTTIEWTEYGWPVVTGCSRVSEGCRNCYSEKLTATRLSHLQQYKGLAEVKNGHAQWTGEVRLNEAVLQDPLHWRKPRRIFVCQMSDLFHPKVSDDFINRVFAVMALCPQHTFQILTKRPKRMLEYVEGFAVGESDLIPPFGPVKHADGLRAAVHNWPLPNVWLGVSVEDQKTADERIPLLLQTPAAVRWLSYEPALGPLNLEELPSASGIGRYLDSLSNAGVDPGAKIPSKLDWVIAGGESGPHARPSHPDWFRSVRDQCHAAGVPFFFKQWGEWVQSPDSEDAYDAVRGFLTVPLGGAFKRVGKKRAGRMLDGREWNEYPSSTGLHK